MQIKKEFELNGFPRSGVIEQPETCPRCHYKIWPKELACKTFTDNELVPYCAAMYLCPNCRETFIAQYSFYIPRNTFYGPPENQFIGRCQYCGPSTPREACVDEKVKLLSPEFVRIFNQASYAEELNLLDIAGMGYRKSLEFLIKDFCIHRVPEDADTIKGAFLGDCIKNRIEDEKIKILAARAAWLGNDAAHYIQKHEGRDIKDIKNFIEACVYFVGKTLVFEDAEGLDSR